MAAASALVCRCPCTCGHSHMVSTPGTCVWCVASQKMQTTTWVVDPAKAREEEPPGALAQPDQLDINIRPMEDGDWNFIFVTWSKSYRDNFHWLKDTEYNEIAAKLIWHHRGRKDASFWVATDPDDDSHIIGWLCSSPGAVHYVYVRAAMRRAGVCLRLLCRANPDMAKDASRVTVTYWTRALEAIDRQHPLVLLFRPSRRMTK